MKNKKIAFVSILLLSLLFLIVYSIRGIYLISVDDYSSSATVSVIKKPHSAKNEVKLKVGQNAKLGNYDIKLLAVTEDSRCPAETLCVWAGRLSAKIYLNGDNYKGESTVELGAVDKKIGTVKLINASPLSKPGEKLSQSDYLLTFSLIK